MCHVLCTVCVIVWKHMKRLVILVNSAATATFVKQQIISYNLVISLWQSFSRRLNNTVLIPSQQ